MENNLEKEAREYNAKTEYSKYSIEKAFIAGANSKYVQLEKMKGQYFLLFYLL